MSSAPSDIRLPHGTCFQEVYAIRLDAAIANLTTDQPFWTLLLANSIATLSPAVEPLALLM